MTIGMNKFLTPKEKQLLEETYLIGHLYDDENSFRRAITEDENGNRRFILETLSEKPALLHQIMDFTDVFISYDTRQYNYLANYEYFGARNKEEALREILKNKLIVFKPQLTLNKKTGRYFFNFEIVFDEKVDGKEIHEEWLPIPILTEGRKSFEEKILSQKVITLHQYNHSSDTPTMVICEQKLYVFTEGAFQKYDARKDAYRCMNNEGVKVYDLPGDWLEHVKGEMKNLCFAPSTYMKSVKEMALQHGISLVTNHEKKVERKEPVTTTIKIEKNAVKKAGVHHNEEVAFIRQVHQAAVRNGLMFQQNDIIQLHTSLKTATLTILGGMSGTGKTQLARTYAETLGLVEGDTLLTIPVSPSFTEPSDLLGFLNHQTGNYIESETGLVSFLYKAQQHPEKIHMVIFDEMNIGQVEHYFSDFISLLELPVEHRTLHLFSKDYKCQESHLCGGIQLGKNVLFVGTANFDETTKDFSNRMLDRSNVIALTKLSFAEAKQLFLQPKEEKKDGKIENSSAVYLGWIHEDGGLELLEDEQIQVLDALHREMNEYDSQMGVSFRMVNGIARFLENMPTNEEQEPLISTQDSFDYQIKQRILTKIRGHREQIEHLVGSIRYDGVYEEGSLLTILDDEERFPISRAYIMVKAKELMRNGYTL